MARIYCALDVNLNRNVAIKVIDIPHRSEAEYVQRFKREAQAIAQLDHPHIVRLYRYGEVAIAPTGDNVLYMAMQFIEGADLQFVLDSYRKDGEIIETTEVSRIIREVCEALDYAHGKGIVHRDVKPSNIMLDKQGRAILTDFGLALLATQVTRGEIFGSPQYIAPEQAMSSAKAVPQSDIYAMGVILYEMITGVLPFNADEPLELALMHMTYPAPSPRNIRPEISEELETVMLKVLEKQPEDRYPTGKALADALDKALMGKSQLIPTTRMSLPQRVALGVTDEGLPPNDNISPPNSAPVTNTIQDEGVEHTRKDILASGAAVVPGQTAASDLSAGPVPTSPFPLSGQSEGKRQNRRSWMIAVLGGLLLLFICLGSSGVYLYNQFFVRPKAVSTAIGSAEKSPTALFGITNPTNTPENVGTPVSIVTTQAPTVTPTKPVMYQLEINRQGKNIGYLVLSNTGVTDIPVYDLSLRLDKSVLSGSDWGVQQLTPGYCLLAWKADHKGNDGLPKGVTCKLSGQTVAVSKTQEGVFREQLEVFSGDQWIGTCDRDQTLCQFSFTN
jgi:serine/threonine protein kinase